MKHPHHALDAVLDFEPEATGRPVVVGQPPPPAEESVPVRPALHEPVSSDPPVSSDRP